MFMYQVIFPWVCRSQTKPLRIIFWRCIAQKGKSVSCHHHKHVTCPPMSNTCNNTREVKRTVQDSCDTLGSWLLASCKLQQQKLFWFAPFEADHCNNTLTIWSVATRFHLILTAHSNCHPHNQPCFSSPNEIQQSMFIWMGLIWVKREIISFFIINYPLSTMNEAKRLAITWGGKNKPIMQ